MGEVQTEVREWLRSQQDWLQEAAQALLKKGWLTEEDIQGLTRSIKTGAGRAVTGTRQFDELGGNGSRSKELRLVKIANVVGIENLAPRRPLEFGTTSLVVVYGHNGAGKSGYTRILKSLAGKPRASALRTNVFQTPTSTRGCEIVIARDGIEETIKWEPESGPADALRSIDIFDADEATHYLSRENAASYTPSILAMFESLAKACDRIRSELQREQDSLSSALPKLPAEYAITAAGVSFNGLTVKTTQTQIDKFASWSEADEARLDELSARLKEADPTAVAKQKRSAKRQAEKIGLALNRYAEAYGIDGLSSIRQLRAESAKKRRAAEDAGLLASAKLEGIGSDSWVALWEAARLYSALSYPDKEFPFTEDNARCVLCQQKFDPDAQRRMRDFERFVEGTLAAEAEKADQAYKDALAALPEAKDEEAVRTQCEAAMLVAPEFVASMLHFWRRAAEIRKLLTEGEEGSVAEPLVCPVTVIAEIQQYCNHLEKQAAQSDQDAAGLNRAQLETERLNLEARKWVSQQAAAIGAEIVRLKNSKELEDCKSAANSRKVTIKAGELAERLITQEYVARFNRELQALGAGRLKVGLVKTRAERGKALHRLQLKGAKQNFGVESILSEGERRVVSLAAFLADVVDKPEPATFIFDDPISSLDQAWEEKTAARLIEVSRSRQVVVFTHRLSMLNHFPDSAEVVYMRQEPWGAGETGEVPLFGRAPEKGLADLKGRRLPQARNALRDAGSEAYYPLAKALCSDFRILIERFVEIHFLAEVVQRHRREVNTKGKIHKLLNLRAEDCDLVSDLMTRYSRYEHSQSDEAPVDLPTVEELEEDMQKLLDWHAEFKKR